MYKPDPRILRYLREHDPDLGARWDRDIQRWRVTWRGKDALLCQAPDGEYQPLDERMVTKVRLSDAWQHGSTREMLRIMDEEHHRLTERQRAKVRDDFRQMCIEDGPARRWSDSRNVFAGWSPN